MGTSHLKNIGIRRLFLIAVITAFPLTNSFAADSQFEFADSPDCVKRVALLATTLKLQPELFHPMWAKDLDGLVPVKRVEFFASVETGEIISLAVPSYIPETGALRSQPVVTGTLIGRNRDYLFINTENDVFKYRIGPPLQIRRGKSHSEFHGYEPDELVLLTHDGRKEQGFILSYTEQGDMDFELENGQRKRIKRSALDAAVANRIKPDPFENRNFFRLHQKIKIIVNSGGNFIFSLDLSYVEVAGKKVTREGPNQFIEFLPDGAQERVMARILDIYESDGFHILVKTLAGASERELSATELSTVHPSPLCEYTFHRNLSEKQQAVRNIFRNSDRNVEDWAHIRAQSTGRKSIASFVERQNHNWDWDLEAKTFVDSPYPGYPARVYSLREYLEIPVDGKRIKRLVSNRKYSWVIRIDGTMVLVPTFSYTKHLAMADGPVLAAGELWMEDTKPILTFASGNFMQFTIFFSLAPKIAQVFYLNTGTIPKILDLKE